MTDEREKVEMMSKKKGEQESRAAESTYTAWRLRVREIVAAKQEKKKARKGEGTEPFPTLESSAKVWLYIVE